MSVLCKLFGHKMPTGYAGGAPYLEPRGGSTDGIGQEHWWLYGRCPRCDTSWHIANVHGPLNAAPFGYRAEVRLVRADGRED